nr:hypothetical protein [uncultured Draconibacterium sp.]
MLTDDYFQKKENILFELLDNSKNEFTAKALKRFYKKNQSINNVVINIDIEKDFYTCFPLIRCQIEHFLIVIYIWLKFMIDKNDDTAKRYYQDYYIQEFIKRYGYIKSRKIDSQSRYMNAISKTIDKLKSTGKLNDEVIKLFNNISKELNGIKNEFSVPKISDFINEKLPENITPFFQSKRTKELLEEYNYLSTFIHGGPTADLSVFEYTMNEMKDASLDYVEKSSNLLSIQRFHIVYFLAMENEGIKNEMRQEFDKQIDEGKNFK